ncbi:hypothetical protein LSCM1_00833 [Leishmania martiniquensis]|uniref:Uncharacterized protein n=1 Tax=Leishmania martiniquensis TaxID=1580590 RepID=A0A836G5E4_9TRYP|nr:hypothetical protein LSCM1_00833 [Leishmania martiniquensis]
MAYAYTDPTSIDYILQRTYDELRRGESQHCRSTEAQYTHHVKELLNNLERYLETCGVRLPTEVQEGADISVAAAAASAQENEQTAFPVPERGHLVEAQRVSRGYHMTDSSASVPATVSSAKCDRDAVNLQGVTSSNRSAHSSGPVPSGWGNLATPCEAQHGGGAASVHHVTGSRPGAAAPATVCGTSLQSELAHAVSGTSPSYLRAGRQRHPARDSRSAHTTKSESEASILYNSQQATRANAAYSSSLPSMAVDVATDGHAESNIASLVYSGDAAGVESCSLDSGNAPIVAIINAGYGDGNGARSRGHGENTKIRSPPAPPKLREYYTGEGARGGLCTSGDGVSRSSSSRPTVSNAIAATSGVSDTGAGAPHTAAGLDRWGEFGMFVQSITESRQNSNLASLRSVTAAGYPQPDGVSSAAVSALPTGGQKEEAGSTGASSAPFAMAAPSPGATSKLSFQLPYVLSTGTSMTTPPTPVLDVAAGRQVHQQQQKWGGAKAHTSFMPLQVAHGAGSSAVRALAAAEISGGSNTAELEGNRRPSPSSGVVSSPIPLAPLPRQRCVDEAGAGVPQVECIPSPPPHSRASRPACRPGVVSPTQCAAPVSFAGNRLGPGGSDCTDSFPYCQRAQRGSVPPHARASASAASATATPATTLLTRSAEKEQLMRRLQGVLKRPIYAPSSGQSSTVPSAAAAEPQPCVPNDPALGIEGKQNRQVAIGGTRAPAPTLTSSSQPALQSQRMPNCTAPSPSTTKTSDTSGGPVNAQRRVGPPEHESSGHFGDAAGVLAWNRSWDFLRLATIALSGCPHTSSSNDISEPATSQKVSCSTILPKDAGGDKDGSSCGFPQGAHQLKDDLRAQRYVGSSDKDAIMTTATPPAARSADGGWNVGSGTRASIVSVRGYAKEIVAPSSIVNAQRHPPSSITATSSTRPTRSTPPHSPSCIVMRSASSFDGYKPDLANSGIDNFSGAEQEKLRAYKRQSMSRKGGLTDAQHQPQRHDGGSQSFSTDLAPSHAEKQQLMHRLRILLSRSDECALSGG